MKRTEKRARVVAMAERLAREQFTGGLESLSDDSPLEELALPEGPETAAARDALRKIRENRADEITDVEMGGFEAIVMPKWRPVGFIRNGRYDDLEKPWTHLNAEASRKIIEGTLPSVGRVELLNTPWTYGGTAFVVGPDLLMTNRHVAQAFAVGLGDKQFVFHRGSAGLDFNREDGAAEDDTSAAFTVDRIEMIHPYWDMALLRVKDLAAAHAPLKLCTRNPEELTDTDVVVVGYPARDDRSDLALQDQIFRRKYNVKRLQPGKLRPRARVRSFDNEVLAMAHDSSTLGGNSGSAVIDAKTGEVVALHFGGFYLKSNYGVPVYELARDGRVVAKGLNFKGRVTSSNQCDAAWRLADGIERSVPVSNGGAAARGGSGKPASGSTDPATRPTRVASVAAGTVSMTVPLTISISLGEASLGTQPATRVEPGQFEPIAGAEERPMQVPINFPKLGTRRGYRAGFLELEDDEEVALPTLTAAGKKIAAPLVDDNSVFELKYHHFSVLMHKERRLALFTAANVDWRSPSRLVDGKKPTRRELTGIPEGVAEQWVTDRRIAEEHQLPDVFYTRDGGAFDKGHVVRRDDVAWGTSLADMQKGNGDTYHVTNCSPQVAGFNQAAAGDDNWGDLENLVQTATKAERVCTFAGPVFDDDDPRFVGRDVEGEIEVQIPRRFWKIVVAKTDDGPRAYGFVLEQDLSGVPVLEEFNVPAAWRRYMKSIADIEGLLRGWVKLTWLKDHDGFDSTEGRRLATRAARR